MPKPLHLALFGAAGPQENWFDNSLYDWRDPALDRDIAKMAERAKIDMMFFADTLAIPENFNNSYEYGVRIGGTQMDPLLTLANVAAVTKHIGLTATVSTIYPPYIVARQLATLDSLSNGRVGWNVVTSHDAAAGRNFGVELPPHDLRYDIADEHFELCQRLWASWEPGALLNDYENRVFADHTKVHRVDFEGKYFKSRGPFNHPPMPQGSPVIIVAGSSERGIRFTAEHGEMTIGHKSSIEDMKKLTTDLRAALVKAGRDPHACKVFFSIHPWMGETESEAKQRMQDNAARANIEDGVARLSYLLGIDLSKFDWDKPLPNDLELNAMKGKIIQESTGQNAKTIRELAHAEAAREDMPIYGSYGQVAEYLGWLAEETGADGYHFRHATKDFAYVVQITAGLIPELRKRRPPP
ncbi:NtaA/DmoA family FMN-dependent monooxygenase [Sphingomonas sp. 3P27F8]|uniref:NtaA/DmoA family FMN-dependent monooxygenase n=1 Tax=Sphingomonas sp. 3P27F8 TaxID=2502213 RepID=UPI0014859E35|nr:NtaA/DmoA family FMN-dependent monooxygenase [Sphingomonas sp. 3P27F8]